MGSFVAVYDRCTRGKNTLKFYELVQSWASLVSLDCAEAWHRSVEALERSPASIAQTGALSPWVSLCPHRFSWFVDEQNLSLDLNIKLNTPSSIASTPHSSVPTCSFTTTLFGRSCCSRSFSSGDFTIEQRCVEFITRKDLRVDLIPVSSWQARRTYSMSNAEEDNWTRKACLSWDRSTAVESSYTSTTRIEDRLSRGKQLQQLSLS